MKTIAIVLLLLTGCAADAGRPAPSESTSSSHAAYTCAALSDAGAAQCIDDFRTGSGSDCVYTCDQGTCLIVRESPGSTVNVATCTR